MGGVHIYQRTDRHKELLSDRKREVRAAILRAAKGLARKTRVSVHPSHFHVFASIGDKSRSEFIARMKEEIARLEGIRWAPGYYLDPVHSLENRHINKHLREIHKDPLI